MKGRVLLEVRCCAPNAKDGRPHRFLLATMRTAPDTPEVDIAEGVSWHASEGPDGVTMYLSCPNGTHGTAALSAVELKRRAGLGTRKAVEWRVNLPLG